MRRSGARLGAGTPPAHPDIREEFSRFMDSERKIRIVPMNGDHLDEIAALERVCFPDPWSRDMLAEELENDLAAFLVALDDQGAVAGYAGLQVVLDEGYILNVAVRPDCRRQGVAKELLQVFLDFAKGRSGRPTTPPSPSTAAGASGARDGGRTTTSTRGRTPSS